jgi:dUTP pyrophosphatase
MVSAWNRSQTSYTLQPLERLAQLVVLPVTQVQFSVVDEFEQSSRGTGGFGSTGKA